MKNALNTLKRSAQRLQIDFIELALVRSKTNNKKWISPKTGDELNVEACVLDYFTESGWCGYAKEGRVLLDLIKAMSFKSIEPWNAYSYVESFYFHGISPWKFNEQVFTPDELLANVKNATRDNINKNLDVMLAKNYTFSTPYWTTTHSRDESEIVEKSMYIDLLDNLGHDLIYNIAKKFRENSYKYRSGWPDITMWKDMNVLFVEVKTSKDRFHDSQKIIIEEFAKPLNLSFALVGVDEA